MGYYSNPGIEREIKRRASLGFVTFSYHGDEQANARGIDEQQILHCLKSGTVIGEDWNSTYQSTTYRMRRQHPLNKHLIVVVGLDETDDVVVTAFWKER